MKHVSYPKIEQFRNVVQAIHRKVNFVGLDHDGEPIYNPSISKPTLKFKGTVKLHGTNAGVSYNQNGIWAQSRTNIITLENDNAGFAFFVESNKDIFSKMMEEIVEKEKVTTSTSTISIFGEWVGKGIQKGTAISNIDKSFFIFGVKRDECWLPHSYLKSPKERIFNINDYQTYELDIDFNMPELAQNKLAEITEAVEQECPVAKTFGISGVGEGVVWSTEYKRSVYRFKVKGQKHSVSKVKKLANVDVEKLESIREFVDYAVTENRFDQAVNEVFGSSQLDVTKLGELLRWIVNDITVEEQDTMVKNNLEPKDVNKYISGKAKEIFFKRQI